MSKNLKTKKIGQTRQPYSPPKIEAMVIELEQGIAAGSATVNSGGSAEPAQEEWGTNTNRDGNLDW